MSEMSNNDYLIHLSSEFNRNGKVDTTGSDHGRDSVHTIISNKISSHQLLEVCNTSKNMRDIGDGEVATQQV